MAGRALAASLLTAALFGLGVSSAAVAQTHEQLRVAVDWRRVSDADVERCGLERLRAGTIERLVDEGHAVVDAIDERGIRVAVASSPRGLRLQVASGEIMRDEMLSIDESCDATFVLDVITRIAELVAEVGRARPPPPAQPAPTPDARVPADAGAEPPERSALQGSLDLTARINASPDLSLGGGLGLRARLPAGWELGGRVELTGTGDLGVTILEGFLGPAVAYQPALPGAGAYLELGPVLHLASSDVRSVSELDAAGAAGLQISIGHLVAHLLLYARLRRFEHRVGETTAFDGGSFGIIVRVGAQLSGS